MTVWVVARGEYSDWTIAGVFTSLEKAQAYIDNGRFMNDPPYLLDTFETDSSVARLPNKVRVTLYKDSKGKDQVKISEPSSWDNEDVYTPYRYGNSGVFATTIDTFDHDYDKAVKIARDRKAKYLYGMIERGEL